MSLPLMTGIVISCQHSFLMGLRQSWVCHIHPRLLLVMP